MRAVRSDLTTGDKLEIFQLALFYLKHDCKTDTVFLGDVLEMYLELLPLDHWVEYIPDVEAEVDFDVFE